MKEIDLIHVSVPDADLDEELSHLFLGTDDVSRIWLMGSMVFVCWIDEDGTVETGAFHASKCKHMGVK